MRRLQRLFDSGLIGVFCQQQKRVGQGLGAHLRQEFGGDGCKCTVEEVKSMVADGRLAICRLSGWMAVQVGGIGDWQRDPER